MNIRRVLIVAIAVLMTAPVSSAVLDSAANGFTIKHSAVVSAGRAEVYGAAVDKVSQWWDGDHSISGNAENLFIDAVPNGCFCEKLGPGAGLIHLIVTFVNPGTMLRFTGGLGPLGLMGVTGNMTLEFEEHDDGTLVTLNYAVGGYLDGGLDAIAPAVDTVLVEQVTRLKALVETGENQN